MRKKWKFLVGVLIIVIALGYLGYRGYAASASFYYEIGEYMSIKDTLGDKQVRVAGIVAPGSIEQSGLNLKFVVTDGQQDLPVTYQGVVPDSFRAGGEVTVEGRINSTGAFVATNVLPKCASKYAPVPS